jgi:hypothetical protein
MGVHLTAERFDVKGFFHCSSILGCAAIMILARPARDRRRPVVMPEKTNPWTQDSETLQCPRCGSRDTRRSYPNGLADALIRMFEFAPFRCRQCMKRFIRKPLKRILPADSLASK